MKNVAIVLSLLLSLLLLGLSGQVQAKDVSFDTLPREGASLNEFIPKGWKADLQVSGDLNGDGVPDVAAILIQDKPDNDQGDADEGPSRAIIVLLGTGDGKFVLAGRNDTLLQCQGCGGIKDFADLRIQKGVLLVYQMSGSREYTYNTWRFRCDPKAQRFVLIGLDSETGDNVLLTKTIESSNYLTGMKTIQKINKKSTTTTKEENSSRQTPFLEDVAE